MSQSREALLGEIATEIESLTESPLYEYRVEHHYHPVSGEGDPQAEIMFVGEAPGENEAKSGRPFVGASGRLLDELLAGIGLERQKVYITNIVKDRPPKNRSPRVGEIRLYFPFLVRQIAVIQPRVIATLGRFAMDAMLKHFDAPEKTKKISELHGSRIDVQAPYGNVAIVPLYHPAVALYTNERKPELVADFQNLQAFVA
ncbi:MAG: uracil-DNA glycosylase [Caldilineaceae bacterium]|nr:uracil-DNA glycosylase [Caldilineaceae bacterium]MCB0121221.1 uracil-DNA glycosylase [Caldilineaceae bacterium]